MYRRKSNLSKIDTDTTSEESCSNCGKKLGFLECAHRDDPVRWMGGAVYVDGAGQLCPDCAGAVYPLKTRFNMRWG
jgi:hypothetical protein